MSANPLAARTQAAYHAAADTYDDPALGFWDRFGRATVDRLALPAGARVLDICCGSGASALPAAAAVGPSGRVVGVDLAPGLIALARRKAAERGLVHAEFVAADFLELAEPPASFDAVVCVFGIFFLPDMPAAIRALRGFLKPGGRMAVTTWGPEVFEPANTIFWEAVRALRPELYKGFNPWDRISQPAAVTALLAEGGMPGANAEAVAGTHPLRSPEDWWRIVMGSGYRGIVEQLTADERGRLKDAVLQEVSRRRIDAIATHVIFAVATKA